MKGLGWLGFASALAATVASAGMTTTVALRSQDAALPKLGLPSLRVEIQGTGPVASDTLRGWMAADVLRLTHVRDGEADPSPDYTLVVRFLDDAVDSQDVPFEATLLTHDGVAAWIADGRTTPDGPAHDAAAWRTVGRNVLSALIRDGWLQAKYDPDNPPPAAPVIQRKAAQPK
jgi:hypothetical protein